MIPPSARKHTKIITLRSRVWIALLVFMVALSVRMAYQSASIIRNPICKDAREYYLTAYNLYHFGVYSSDTSEPSAPTWQRPPGYPLFLVPFFGISTTTGAFIANVTFAQAVMGSLAAVVSFLLAAMFFPPLLALAAGLLTALSPHLIAMDDFLLSESLFTFVILLASFTLAQSWKRTTPLLALLAGLFFGLSPLIRPIALLMGPFLILFFPLSRGGLKNGSKPKTMTTILCFLAGLAMIHFPYSHCRARIIQNAISVSKQSVWQHVVLGADVNLARFLLSKTDSPYKTETTRMTREKKVAMTVFKDRFLNAPLAHLRWFLGGKVFFMWKWDSIYVGDVYQYPMTTRGFDTNRWLSAIHRMMKWLHWPIFISSIIGAVLFLIKRSNGSLEDHRRLILIPILMCVYFSGLLSLMMPLPRYAIPLRPFVYMLALYPMTQFGRLYDLGHQTINRGKRP